MINFTYGGSGVGEGGGVSDGGDGGGGGQGSGEAVAVEAETGVASGVASGQHNAALGEGEDSGEKSLIVRGARKRDLVTIF